MSLFVFFLMIQYSIIYYWDLANILYNPELARVGQLNNVPDILNESSYNLLQYPFSIIFVLNIYKLLAGQMKCVSICKAIGQYTTVFRVY